jgi:hypothetical protein
MATKKTEAEVAAANYRAALIDRSVDDLVGTLAVKMGEWRKACDTREAELRRLEAAERAAEDAVVAAYEAARAGGAKVSALEKINLKPTAALAAVNKRSKTPREKSASSSTVDGLVSASATSQTSPELVSVTAASVPSEESHAD